MRPYDSRRGFFALGAAIFYAWAVLAPSAWGDGLTLVAAFDGNNGANPVATLTFDAAGNAYGTASVGGSSGFGTVWELVKGSGTITPLATFNGTNGTSPFAGVTLDASGNLFGTADTGGANNVGVVWELAKGSGTITALASFDTTNGAFPRGPVTLDANGNLYGTTQSGGPVGGVIWELAKGSSTIQALASFTSTSGVNPAGRLTVDAAGNLYGMAQNGGAFSKGTVWELAKGSSTIQALASFNSANGAFPFGPVTLDAHGNLFGTALQGGASFGTVWELAKGSGTINTLALLRLCQRGQSLRPRDLRRRRQPLRHRHQRRRGIRHGVGARQGEQRNPGDWRIRRSQGGC